MWAVSCEIPPPNRRTAACRRSWGGAIHARRRTRCARVSAMAPIITASSLPETASASSVGTGRKARPKRAPIERLRELFDSLRVDSTG
jgi:hypothetical protein